MPRKDTPPNLSNTTFDYISKILNLLINLNIGNVELSKTMYEQCFSWMDENKVTFYDACYLAAAFEVQGILITADQNFVSKMGKTKRICLLTNIDLG